MSELIWRFDTKNFRIEMTAEEEQDVDLSWDDTGEVSAKIESGEYSVFCAKCAVYLRGVEVATDYLGNCIYSNANEFRDHLGRNAKGYGSYFSDMVRNAISQAREQLADMPQLRT